MEVRGSTREHSRTTFEVIDEVIQGTNITHICM